LGKRSFVNELFEFVGEPLTSAVIEFADRWPVIHKVTPDNERRYRLSVAERQEMHSNDAFREWVERLGSADV
jgi:hypothetical protein